MYTVFEERCSRAPGPYADEGVDSENKWPDDEGRRRVGATLSPLYHPFAALYLV
jgi:hypothetical protein